MWRQVRLAAKLGKQSRQLMMVGAFVEQGGEGFLQASGEVLAGIEVSQNINCKLSGGCPQAKVEQLKEKERENWLGSDRVSCFKLVDTASPNGTPDKNTEHFVYNHQLKKCTCFHILYEEVHNAPDVESGS